MDRQYGQEYADSLTRHPGMSRCPHGNYVCMRCVKEAATNDKLSTFIEKETNENL